MSERFYSEHAITAGEVTLGGNEAHHLLHVMRSAPGDQVTLFDGRGNQFLTEVTECQRAEVKLKVLQEQEIDRELVFQITVAVVLPKGDRQKWLVEKLTESGATCLVPLVTEHSATEPSSNTIKKLKRSVIEACKQCGRNRLMEIMPAVKWEAFLKKTLDSKLKLIAHPDGKKLPELLAPSAEDMLLAIGPEGGFTTGEVKLATAAQWQAVSLGPRILRIETAAVALVSAITLGR